MKYCLLCLSYFTVTAPFSNRCFSSSPGLSAPVSRGRKGQKIQNHLSVSEAKDADWLVHCNPEVVLQDESYKKHLKQHCNKSVDYKSLSRFTAHVQMFHLEKMSTNKLSKCLHWTDCYSKPLRTSLSSLSVPPEFC